MKHSNDEKVKKLVADLKKIVTDDKLEKNWRGEWFSNSQISRLREVYETKGYQFAREFQKANINLRDSKVKQKEDNALLKALENIYNSNLDMGISSYILGNLNNIIENK